MSPIASFYTLPAKRFDELVTAAAPRLVERQRAWIFKRRVNEVEYGEFLDFLRSVARERQCPLWGGVFLDLDMILEPKGMDLYSLSRRDLSERLSSARDSLNPSRKAGAWPPTLCTRIPVFDHPTAVEAIDRLNTNGPTESELVDHVRSEYASGLEDTAIRTLVDGLELAKNWLASMEPDEIGILLAN